MTSESKEKTEPWIEKHQAIYPYAYNKGGKLSRALKVSGIPAAFLVNPRGKVVWKGHPGNLDASIIKKHISGAKRTPAEIAALTSNWPESMAGVKKLLAKNQIGQALVAAKRLAEKDPGCQAAVETLTGFAEEEVDGVRTLMEIGDILGALDVAKIAKKTLSGSKNAKEVDALIKEIKTNKDASKVVKAQAQLAKLAIKMDDIRKRKDAESMIKKLNKIIAKNTGNYAGESAESLKADLTKAMEKMRR